MRRIITGLIAIACLWPAASPAEIIRFDILAREPAFAGRDFGNVGPYERITARATFALEPRRRPQRRHHRSRTARRATPTARWRPPPMS